MGLDELMIIGALVGFGILAAFARWEVFATTLSIVMLALAFGGGCQPIESREGQYTPPKIFTVETGLVKIHEIRADAIELQEICQWDAGQHNDGAELLGCKQDRYNGTWCIIYILDEPYLTERQVQLIREHEIAHCNGWTHP